jgi:hypothetical protein
MADTNHTSGLLHVETRGLDVTLRAENGKPIANLWMTGKEEFDAERLCAAWNACVDAPTEILSIMGAKVVPPELAYVELKAQRDELLAALDASESILRYSPEISTNCNGTKPSMTTVRALKIARAALAKVNGRECPTCGGYGQVERSRVAMINHWVKCEDCNGTGRVPGSLEG